MFTFLLAPDVEELVISYLASQGFGNISTEMFVVGEDDLPFVTVNCLDAPDDYVSEYAMVSIHTFAKNRTLASDVSRRVHNSMKNMIGVPVLMSDNSYANVDTIDVRERPHWEDYASKEVRRYCARYRITTRCNTTS